MREKRGREAMLGVKTVAQKWDPPVSYTTKRPTGGNTDHRHKPFIVSIDDRKKFVCCEHKKHAHVV
jgi:hypothetical protein